MIILISILALSVAALVFYFPVQRILAEKKYEQYAALQGVYSTDITSRNFQKDYKQGGYFISVAYKSDPNHRYQYHYFLIDYRKSGTMFNTMHCHIFDTSNARLDEFANVTYKPLE